MDTIIVNFMQVKRPLTSEAVLPKKGPVIPSNMRFDHFHYYPGGQRYHAFPCLYTIFGRNLLNSLLILSFALFPNNGRRTSTNFKIHILYMLWKW